jgi:hypothetical protein
MIDSENSLRDALAVGLPDDDAGGFASAFVA